MQRAARNISGQLYALLKRCAVLKRNEKVAYVVRNANIVGKLSHFIPTLKSTGAFFSIPIQN